MSARHAHHTIRHVTTVLAVALVSSRSGQPGHCPRYCSPAVASHPGEEMAVNSGYVQIYAGDDGLAAVARARWLSRQDMAAMAAEYRLMHYYIQSLAEAVGSSYGERRAWGYCDNIAIEATSSRSGEGDAGIHRGNGGGAE